MSGSPCFDPLVWRKRAMAFVTRSHRHLWGKNNEDPQAFLFTRDLKNQFAKTLVLGWNKFGQERPAQNWGQQKDTATGVSADKKLFLPPGIVIPYIRKKELHAVFIHPYDEKKGSRTTLVPGSSSATLILGEDPGKKIAVVQQMFDGLFLFQEAGDAFCVMIHPDPDRPLALRHKSLLSSAPTVFIFSSQKKEMASNKALFPKRSDTCFYPYQSKKDLKKICLSD